ncbi:MAG TPA: cation:proton antiporter [Acidimicrobiia bacterium]|jgi:Kef-type K+ transport system membrane component KefB
MEHLSFGGVFVVALIAVAAPILVAALRLKIPAPVIEILAGILVGPSVLAWVHIDAPISVLALVGVTFLLFLAGLEIDLERLRGPVLRVALIGYVLTLVLGVAVGLGAHAAGLIRNPLLLAVALSATSLGLVVPVLKDAGQTDGPVGHYTIAGATVADFAAVLLLSLLFSESKGGAASKVFMFAMFIAVVLAVALTLGRAGRIMRFDALITRLQDTTAEIRVRIAVALLVGFVALAERVGLETILGAFLAGAVLNLVDRDTMSHPRFRAKLDAVGYGFVIPFFFVASGIMLDLRGVFSSTSGVVRIPVFLVALLVVRAVPAVLYRRATGTRGAVAAGLLQATTLPFLVTATAIGVSIGALSAVTGAALVCAGLLSVVIFPGIALALLRGQHAGQAVVGAPA